MSRAKMMQLCKAQGFAYGIIPEKGKPFSDNLRAWWKEKVPFHLDGPAAIFKYQSDHMIVNDGFGALVCHTPHFTRAPGHTSRASLLSALMQHCHPSQRRFPLEKGVALHWTGAMVGPAGICKSSGPPPYKKLHDLKKPWKADVPKAVIKHASPDIGRIRKRHSRVFICE